MVVSTFSLLDKDGREGFFEKSFLLADIKPDTMLEILFLIMRNANIDFQARNLQWRSYTIGDVLLTIRWVELIEKKKFATIVLNPKYKIFLVYIAALSVDSSNKVYFSKKTQIAHLKVDEALTNVLNKYTDFANTFLPKLAAELPEHRISHHIIKLVDDWQPLYSLIYSLESMKLEILKAYMENILTNGFIRLSKFPAGAYIFFEKKPDISLRLCINYWSLNNLTIKNWYLLPLVRESLCRLGRAQRFI